MRAHVHTLLQAVAMAAIPGTQAVITGFFSQLVVQLARTVVPQDHILLGLAVLTTVPILVARDTVTEFVYKDKKVDDNERVLLGLSGIAAQTMIFTVVGILVEMLRGLFMISVLAWYEALALGFFGISLLFALR